MKNFSHYAVNPYTDLTRRFGRRFFQDYVFLNKSIQECSAYMTINLRRRVAISPPPVPRSSLLD